MFLYSTTISIAGPTGSTEITLTAHFSIPPSGLPEVMDNVIERELQNAIVRIMERAKKDRK